jgi:hypothetical protein
VECASDLVGGLPGVVVEEDETQERPQPPWALEGDDCGTSRVVLDTNRHGWDGVMGNNSGPPDGEYLEFDAVSYRVLARFEYSHGYVHAAILPERADVVHRLTIRPTRPRRTNMASQLGTVDRYPCSGARLTRG